MKFIIHDSISINLRAEIRDEPRMNPTISGLILGLRPANGRRRYKVTPSLIS